MNSHQNAYLAGAGSVVADSITFRTESSVSYARPIFSYFDFTRPE